MGIIVNGHLVGDQNVPFYIFCQRVIKSGYTDIQYYLCVRVCVCIMLLLAKKSEKNIERFLNKVQQVDCRGPPRLNLSFQIIYPFRPDFGHFMPNF